MVKVEVFKIKNNKFLFLNDYLWMWDLPHEKGIQMDIAKKAFGDILVVGYGFGILHRYLAKNKNVTSITTIEKYPEVIEYIKELDKIYGRIIIGDFNYFSGEEKYDCVIGDHWPEIDSRFLGDYLKFKNEAKKLLKINGLILGWGMDYFEYLLEKK